MLLSDGIDTYIAAREPRMKASTLQQDSVVLRSHFLAEVGNIEMRRIRQSHLDGFAATIAKLAPKSYNLYVSNVARFIEWMKRRGHMPTSFIPDLPTRSLPTKERNRVPISDFPKLLDAARHPRDRILIATGLHLLLRPSEVTSLKVSDLSMETGTIQATIHKTGDSHLMTMDLGLEAEMRRWLAWYQADQGVLQEDWFLVPRLRTPQSTGKGFESHEDSSLSVQPHLRLAAPARPVQAALQAIGFPTDREGGHTLRRSGARAYFDTLVAKGDGYDGALRSVMTLLHHKQQSTTEIYLGLTADRAKLDKEMRGQFMYPQLHEDVVSLADRREADGSQRSNVV